MRSLARPRAAVSRQETWCPQECQRACHSDGHYRHQAEPHRDHLKGLWNHAKTSVAIRKPLCGECQSSKQQERVSKMETQKESVGCGSVQATNVIDQD